MKTRSRNQQLSFEIPSHGGARDGAGRPRKLVGDPIHTSRPELTIHKPVHVSVKLLPGLPSLRTPTFARSLLRAINRMKDFGVYVQHFDIESNHLHLILEAESKKALERAMISLKCAIVWALRKIFMFHGRVFKGRYHLQQLTTPTQVRNAIKYVLFNHAKHLGRPPFLDAFSSAFAFAELTKLVGPLKRTTPRPGKETWKARLHRRGHGSSKSAGGGTSGPKQNRTTCELNM